MPTPKKDQTIEEIADVFRTSSGVFLTDFSGLNVERVTELRKRCHEQSVGFRVVKNTLARRAADVAGMPDLSEWLTGSTALAYADEPTRAIKLLQQFVKDVREANGKPEIKTGIVDQVLLDGAELKMLADLPAPDVVKAKFLGLLNAPAQQFVGLLAAAPSSFARVLDQRRQNLEEDGNTAEAGS